MQKMKIGIIIVNFYPTRGGAEDYAYFLAKGLSKDKENEVHVFCSSDRDSEEKIEEIKVHRCKTKFKLTYYLHFFPSLTKKLKEYPLDVIHVIGIGFPQYDIAINSYLKAYPNTKIVCTPHGPFMALNKYSLFKSLLKSMYMPFLKKNLSKYHLMIQDNPFQEKWMIQDYKIPKEKIVFIPIGLPEENFKSVPKSSREKVYSKYNLKNKFLISYTGRIQKYKGLDQMIKILPDLIKINKDILFLAIGKDVGDRTRLEKLAKELGVFNHIRFTSQVSEQEKLALLDLSEIFIFPSEWEAFGIVMLEAMARKNAIISTRTEGGRFLIKDRENGLLFDYQNTKELLKTFLILLKNRSILDRIQKENVKKAEKLRWKYIIQKFKNEYSNLLK